MSLTKFCIYHQPRTGSTMLWGILSNHPEILCDRELFHHKEKFKTENTPWANGYSNYKTSREYLQSVLYPQVQSDHKAVGFKLQGYQAREKTPPHVDIKGELLDVRRYLLDEDYKFIVPHRLNKMEQYISQLVAKKIDNWQRWIELPNGEKRDDPAFEVTKVFVTEDNFKNWYKWESQWSSRMEEEMKGKEVLRIIYERFLIDWDNQISRMLKFLGVSEITGLEPKTKKARTRPLREWIENYEEACEIHDRHAAPHEVEYRIEHE